jgi:MinD superfamily P-loop ATPase
MKIAIASGKGGAGKTMLAVNLALVAGRPVSLLDCDVEAPNAHLFLDGEARGERSVDILAPVIDAARCNNCGVCVQFCRFNALIAVGKVPLVVADLCHGCGGCVRVCRRKAIREVARPIGAVETFAAGDILLTRGRMEIGTVNPTPIVRAVKQAAAGLTLLDGPPGASCAMVETIRGADYVLLVAEPTPFGISDLGQAVEAARAVGAKFGIVVNRADDESGPLRAYCRAEGVEIVAEFPHDRRIAEVQAHGERVAEALPDYRGRFEALLETALARGSA